MPYYPRNKRVFTTVTLSNLLSLPTSLSLLQEQNTQFALSAGMADIIPHIYHMVRPQGCDVGTQTEREGKEDKTSQMKWVLQ